MHIEEGKDRFFIKNEAGAEIGELTFTHPQESVMSVDHTYVSPEYRGQHLAGQLLQAVVDKAVRENKKIIPVCSYAKAQFARQKQYQKVEYKG